MPRKYHLEEIVKTCGECRRTMDVDLFDPNATTCQLCLHKPDLIARQKARWAQRQREAHERRRSMTPAARYRHRLVKSGQYSEAQIEAFVARRFG